MEKDISIERAHELIVSRMARLPEEEIAVDEAVRRVLSRDLYCQQSIPAWPQSAVDGWALTQAGEAGSRYQLSQDTVLHGRQACRVVTGGMLPADTAAVVPEENTRIDAEEVVIREMVAPGSNIKQVGEDFAAGELLLPAHSVLDWGAIGMLAAAGVYPIPVVRRPRVAILAISDKLVSYKEVPPPGFARDCNSPLLSALIQEDGGAVIKETDVQNPAPLSERLRLLAERSDVVLIIGGTYNQNGADACSLMLAINAQIWYWGVAVQPGSHHGCGIYRGCLLLALSGNPGACAVSYHLFAAPVLRRLQGISPESPMLQARCVNSFSKPTLTRRLVRGRAWVTPQGWEVAVLPGQKSSMVRSLPHCNALIDLPAGSPPPQEGDTVSVILLDRNQLLPPVEQAD